VAGGRVELVFLDRYGGDVEQVALIYPAGRKGKKGELAGFFYSTAANFFLK